MSSSPPAERKLWVITKLEGEVTRILSGLDKEEWLWERRWVNVDDSGFDLGLGASKETSWSLDSVEATLDKEDSHLSLTDPTEGLGPSSLTTTSLW